MRLALAQDLLLCSALLALPFGTQAQAPTSGQPEPQPSAFAAPLTIDRGSAGLAQTLKKLGTRASLIAIVAHPDDEDGGMLAYESRQEGVDGTLLTLNRGEGGQNVMSADFWDQLGILRTEELLAADQFYGVHQYFTRVTDFGFSKTIDEALKQWGHDRVLYDCVRVVRLTRPLVVTSSFAGNVSDGHGQHQVSGLMAQEVFNAAADPDVFPDQIRAGLRPWAPLKVYARVPFARVTERGIYDYATGHWEPVRFRNYVSGQTIEGIPSTTVEIPESTYNPLFGRSDLAVAREGLGQQKSQNGGIGAPPARQFLSPYHIYASRVSSGLPQRETSFFQGIDTSLAAIADYAPAADRDPWRNRLNQIAASVTEATNAFYQTAVSDPAKSAPALSQGLAKTDALLRDLAASSLPDDAKYNMRHELELKRDQFNTALSQSLGLSVQATLLNGRDASRFGPFGDMSNQAGTSQTVIPGQTFNVNLHLANQGKEAVTVLRSELVSHAGPPWSITADPAPAPAATSPAQAPGATAPTRTEAPPLRAAPTPGPTPSQSGSTGAAVPSTLTSGEGRDQIFSVSAPADAGLTRPYFSRPNLEQPFYDILDPADLSLPNMPYPLSAEVTYTYMGVEAHISGVVQTIHRITGPGPLPEPLLVAPAISLTVSPEAGIVPLTSAQLHLAVLVHSSVKGPATGTVRLELPPGWTSNPAVADFATASDGEDRTLSFEVTPKSVQAKPYVVTAVAQSGGREYRQGFQTVGYTGVRPYPFYRPSAYRTTGVDVKVAPDLHIAYITGTGDDVPRSLEDLGLHVQFLSMDDLASADLSRYDAILLGIRTYAARPELRTLNNRLLSYAKAGGIVVVQYQTQEYDRNFGPYPLSLSSDPERVIEEDNAVTLLAPEDPILTWPNRITPADFTGWVEERGHGFLRSWDSHYIALTETHDKDQEPQRGGLVYARTGRGAYIYTSFAFFREMPEGVPGAFRLMANLLSLAKNPAFQAEASRGKP